MRKQVPVETLDVFDHSKDRSNQDEYADDVKSDEMFAPGHGASSNIPWTLGHCFIEVYGDDNEA